MLTQTDLKRIAMCLDYKTNQFTIENLADKHNVSHRTAQRALDWGRKSGFFVGDVQEKLTYHIEENKKHLKDLEDQWKLSKRTSKDKQGKKVPMNGMYVKCLSSEIREMRVLIMELEGLYKKTLSVQVETRAEDLVKEIVSAFRAIGKA